MGSNSVEFRLHGLRENHTHGLDEFAEYERDNLIYDFVTLTPEECEQKKKNYEEFKIIKEAEKAATVKKKAGEAAKKKTSEDKPGDKSDKDKQ